MGYGFAEQDEWRKKYSESLRVFEQESRQNQAQIGSLTRLVNRLCLAAQGQSPRLDQELKRLKDAIRKEASGSQLEPFVQAIADAVHSMDVDKPAGPPVLRVVANEPPAAAIASKPSAPASAGANASLAGEPTAASKSSTTFAPAGATAATSDSGEPAGAARANVPARDASASELRMRVAISQLLTELGRDEQLTAGARAIDAQLSSAVSVEHLPPLIGKVSSLVMQRISALEKSRQELKTLLGQMMGQLDSVTRYIAGQSEDESHRASSADTLNAQISGEVIALGENLDGADLEQVRAQVRERMFSISHHLQGFRERETRRAEMAKERSEGMRERMEAMDLEVKDLQARLSDEKKLLLLDGLTQVPNRLAWDQRYSEERDRWQRFGQATCVAVWDIDGFKGINDTYGHRAGDKVLSVVAEQLSSSIRSTDFVARYGGEEFAMLLPGTSVEDARRLVEHVREAIARIGFHFRGAPVSVTISCGLTMMREGDGDDEAFDRADKALYRAKDGGRNQVVTA